MGQLGWALGVQPGSAHNNWVCLSRQLETLSSLTGNSDKLDLGIQTRWINTFLEQSSVFLVRQYLC